MSGSTLPWRFTRRRAKSSTPEPQAYLDAILPYLIPSRVHAGILHARRLPGRQRRPSAYEPGNGSQVLAPDAVPFAPWVAATHLYGPGDGDVGPDVARVVGLGWVVDQGDVMISLCTELSR